MNPTLGRMVCGGLGFLFMAGAVPLFNFGWIFVCFWKLSQNLNAYTQRHSIAAPRVSEGMALAACILWVTGIIPYLGWVTGLVGLIIYLIVANDMKRASMAIAQAHLEGRAHGGSRPEPVPA